MSATIPTLSPTGSCGLGGLAQAIAAPHYPGLRLTIPAREALEAAGAQIVPAGATDHGAQLWDLTLGDQQPAGLVAEHLRAGVFGIRMVDEPEYPDRAIQDYWTTLDLQPCPICTAPIVWWEAGYVPGHRICTGPEHHHLMPEK
jgi:hypothetical protein